MEDPNKLRTLSMVIEWGATVSVAAVENRKIKLAVQSGWKLVLNTILNAGAEYYLKSNGCDVAALLLQHSLEPAPSNLHFYKSDSVTEKIMESSGFEKAFGALVQTVLENPDINGLPREIYINFQKNEDTDLYYGIGKCKLTCAYTRENYGLRVKFMLEDEYDFDEIRTIRWNDVKKSVEIKLGLGNLANDLGLFAQISDVISPYWIYVKFEKTIELS